MLINEQPFTIDDDEQQSLSREEVLNDYKMSSLTQGSSFFHPFPKKKRQKVKIFPKTNDDAADNPNVENQPLSPGKKDEVKTFGYEDFTLK